MGISPWAGADPGAALQLRDWAIAQLSGGEAPTLPAASPPTWAFFLQVERCALPLSRVLAERESSSLDEVGREALQRAAGRELQRWMAAAAEVKRLDRIASELSHRVVLLKGGRWVGEGVPLFLLDLDVLVPAGTEFELARRLEAEGYRASGSDADHTPHLSPRRLPGSLPVEIHRRIKGLSDPGRLLEGAIPSPGTSHLWHAAEGDHLEHILVHAMAGHPDRRGRLRDALLIGRSVERVSEPELDEVVRRLVVQLQRTDVEDWLALVRGIGGAGPSVDPFRERALHRYTLLSQVGGLSFMRSTVVRAVHVLSDRRGLGEDVQRALGSVALSAPSNRRLTRDLLRIPLVGPWVRAAGRVARSLMAHLLSRYAARPTKR